MQNSEKNTAEQYLVIDEKKKWGVVRVFRTCWDVVSVSVKLWDLADKWWPMIKEYFGLDS